MPKRKMSLVGKMAAEAKARKIKKLPKDSPRVRAAKARAAGGSSGEHPVNKELKRRKKFART
jgi:hypothetical protein